MATKKTTSPSALYAAIYRAEVEYSAFLRAKKKKKKRKPVPPVRKG